MNDLFSGSFSRFRSDQSSPDRHHDIEMGATASGGGRGGEVNLDKFFEDVEGVKEELKELEGLAQSLRSSHEQSKTLHNAKAVRDLRARMDGDVSAALKKAKLIKLKLEALERSNAANRNMPGCGPGSSSDRTRTSVVNGLKKKLKDAMESFNEIRQLVSSEYRETVQRRYFTVTGENPDDKTLDLLISTGESETFLQKAIQEQGRGRILDTITEIQERHDAVKEIEKNLKELHQVFLDMTVLVQHQGEQLDDIESHVARAHSFVRTGAEQLQTARKHQKNTRKWTCYCIILLLVIILFVVLFTVNATQRCNQYFASTKIPSVASTSTHFFYHPSTTLKFIYQRFTAGTVTDKLTRSRHPINYFAIRNYVAAKQQKRKMGPKKAVKEEKILLGRPGNNLKSGIVGLANVGKSTLFQAITKCHLGNPANFPFATIDPEESRVIVPDERFDWLCEKYQPKSKVPAHLTIYDIAGLTRGASTGAGLGNAFLSHIRAVDAIFQVVRCFDDAEIIHIEGDVNPVRDLDIISEELRIKDIEFTEKALENIKKQTRRGGQSLEMKKLLEEQACIEKVLALLNGGGDVRKGDWTGKEVEFINPLFLLTAKPVVYLINLSEKDYIRKKNKHLAKVMEWIKAHASGDPIIPISICLEERLTQFETEKEAADELKNLGVDSALPKIITAMRKVLNLGSFFTTGPDEVRQWTIRNGTKAPQAAGVIHGDFEKTFIQAIVYNYSVLKELGDEGEVKAKGKVLTKGKDYVVEDGDILLIKAGAAKG